MELQVMAHFNEMNYGGIWIILVSLEQMISFHFPPTGEGANDAGHGKAIIYINTDCPWKNKFLDSLPDTPGPFGPADFKSGFLKFAKHSPVQSQVILVSDTFPWFIKKQQNISETIRNCGLYVGGCEWGGTLYIFRILDIKGYFLDEAHEGEDSHNNCLPTYFWLMSEK